jgi:pilus assembly protein Flp/PilA
MASNLSPDGSQFGVADPCSRDDRFHDARQGKGATEREGSVLAVRVNKGLADDNIWSREYKSACWQQGQRRCDICNNYLSRRTSSMLKIYVNSIDALKRLRSDKDGVVSFEYVIVAVCIVTAVLAAYGTDTSTGIGNALAGGIAKITTAFNAVP